MSAPTSAAGVLSQLGELARQLSEVVTSYQVAENDAAKKRVAADLAESRAFLAADGTVDFRKHTARVASERQEFDAVVAEALVRSLRQRIKELEIRIDVGRTYGASLRAELKTLGAMEG
jgi:hypothetical protein